MMKGKRYFRGILVFMVGFVSAFIFQFIYPPPRDALADQSCIRQGLKAWGYNGNIPQAVFSIAYDVPSCYAANGYSVEKVFMHGNRVAVTYKSSRPAPIGSGAFSGSGPSSMGDTFRPIP